MELHERVARLERQNRRLMWALGLAVVAVPALLLTPKLGAEGESQSLEVNQKLALKGANGVTAATLWSTNFGANLALNDGAGRPRLVFAVGADGPTVLLLDKDQSTPNRGVRLALGVTQNSGPSVSLFGDDPKNPLAALRTKTAKGEKSASGMLVAQGDDKRQVMFPRSASAEDPFAALTPANEGTAAKNASATTPPPTSGSSEGSR